MATEFNFDNKVITQPGTFAKTESGITNPPLDLSFGNMLVIDNGSGAGFGGGSGIAGVLRKNKDAIYTFDNIRDFRNFVKGGLWWLLASPLFRPNKVGPPGISKINYIKAATTVPAEITATAPFTGDFSGAGSGPNGGTFTIQVNDEGIIGNGGEISAKLTKGFAMAMESSPDFTPVKATGILTLTGLPLDTETVVIDGKTYIFQTTLTDVDGNVQIGGSASDSLDNLIAAITLTGTPGTDYALLMTIHPTVTAAAGVGDTMDVTAKTAGTKGNNFATTETLTNGSWGAITLENGAEKFILKFSRGTFKGLDADGDPWDGILEADTEPLLLAVSPEFDNVQTIFDYFKTNANFNEFFTLKSSLKIGSGFVDSDDLTANTGNILATGGTETFATAQLDTVLDNISELDYTFVLADKFGDNAQSADNVKILAHLVEEARHQKFMVVGGGKDEDKFSQTNGSIPTAEFYDSNRVVVVHGGIKKVSNLSGTGFKERDSIYKAAAVLGRQAGLEPQVPLTFKAIDIDGELHDLKEKDRTLLLKKGVLHTFSDAEIGSFVVNQGINSLQKNKFLVNNDGTSHEWSVELIAAQLNKEITVNAKTQLLAGSDEGPNRNTLKKEFVRVFVSNFLNGKIATETVDNLIISFQNVTVVVQQDAFFVTYEFVPNFPVNKLFFTSILIDIP